MVTKSELVMHLVIEITNILKLKNLKSLNLSEIGLKDQKSSK